MRRRTLLLLLAIPAAAVVAGAALTAAAAPAAKTNECKGLKVCVRVAGPWVVVPAARSTPRVPVEYQLSCPKGYIVGGLDAELSDRGIDLFFLGKLGSPVNPGITTGRDAFFTATYVGTKVTAPTFKPHIGCMPGAGGGGRIQTAVSAFKPGQPTIRRAQNAQLKSSRQRVTAVCKPSERLVGTWTAYGFRGATAPTATAQLSAGVSAAKAVVGRRVTALVQSGTAVPGSGAVFQVGAVCAVVK